MARESAVGMLGATKLDDSGVVVLWARYPWILSGEYEEKIHADFIFVLGFMVCSLGAKISYL